MRPRRHTGSAGKLGNDYDDPARLDGYPDANSIDSDRGEARIWITMPPIVTVTTRWGAACAAR